MNDVASKHLDKAEVYFAKGDSWYAKAADEIIAAQKADPRLSLREIGERFGKGHKWVGSIVTWRTSGSPESGIDWRRGSHGTADEIREGAMKLSQTDPGIVVRMFDGLTPEKREMVVQDLVQHREFADAVKSNPVVRDEMLINVLGTDEQRKERKEERQREDIATHGVHGWRLIIDAFGEANLGLIHAIDGFVKLDSNRGVNSDEDPLNLAKGRAEMIGRSIYEIELVWGETPISDKIEELREQAQRIS
jgi:hypothetical protein